MLTNSIGSNSADSGSLSTEAEIDVSKELAKIKGDAIGDTLYSERWVLRVLIRLSELTEKSWDSELEQSVCALWDMTAEKDVVTFLLSNDFYNLFCKVIRTVHESRCTEIMVGILGNMCCVEEARSTLAEHNASLIVINLIKSQDSLVLVQVLRLLISCLWNLRREDSGSTCTRPNSPTLPSEEEIDHGRDKKATDDKNNCLHPWVTTLTPHKDLILRQLCFFLSSAINDELLCATLELMETLLSVRELGVGDDECSSPQLAEGLAECLWQLLRGSNAASGDSLNANRRLWRAIHVWIGIVGHVASSQQGRINLGSAGNILTKCFAKLVVLLTTPEALKTQEPEIATLCLCVLETLPQIQVSASVLAKLTTVLFTLDKGVEDLAHDSDENLEIKNLLHRGLQFLKHRMEEMDDLAALLQALPSTLHSFLFVLANEDNVLLDRLNRALLQIRTNGLIQ